MITTERQVSETLTAPRPPWSARLLLVIGGLTAYFWTQSLIGARGFPDGQIGDAMHELSAPMNAFLNDHPQWSNVLLILSSAVIDLLGIYLIVWSLVGPSVRPFLGLFILIGLRQLCQRLCALPPPDGMIWQHPGFPSLLVTYGVANDFFFSGHTGIAVYGAMELGRTGPRWLKLLAILVVAFEMATVLVLRAHYTMDVFTGLITALFVAGIVGQLAPACDRALVQTFRRAR